MRYDGHVLTCNGNKKKQGECNGLPIGKPVRAAVISIDFNPRKGKTIRNEWWRNKYSFRGSYIRWKLLPGKTTGVKKPVGSLFS